MGPEERPRAVSGWVRIGPVRSGPVRSGLVWSGPVRSGPDVKQDPFRDAPGPALIRRPPRGPEASSAISKWPQSNLPDPSPVIYAPARPATLSPKLAPSGPTRTIQIINYRFARQPPAAEYRRRRRRRGWAPAAIIIIPFDGPSTTTLACPPTGDDLGPPRDRAA